LSWKVESTYLYLVMVVEKRNFLVPHHLANSVEIARKGKTCITYEVNKTVYGLEYSTNDRYAFKRTLRPVGFDAWFCVASLMETLRVGKRSERWRPNEWCGGLGPRRDITYDADLCGSVPLDTVSVGC
jgi:hypothetical protein